MFSLDRNLERALDLRKQLAAARFSRRELSRLGLIAGGAAYTRGASLRRALAGTVPTMPLAPWVDELPIPRAADEGHYDYNLDTHQYCRGRYEAARYVKLKIQENSHRFHRDLQESKVWSYGDQFGGPLIDVRYGQPVCFQFENTLDTDHVGYGDPNTTAHLHNFHTATESDGGPWNYVHAKGNRERKSSFRVQHYCMTRAGFTGQPSDFADPLAPGGSWWAQDGGQGDLRETLTTLFMHDHRPGYTGPNLYKGLFLMVRAFEGGVDGFGKGDTGRVGEGWNLPCGAYDVPLMFQDKEITRDGEMTFNQFAVDGFMGPYLAVNGKIKPYFNVERRKYRFRLLDGGPSRFYRVVLRKGTSNVKFTQITASGNLLYRPKTGMTDLDLWVGERSDIIVDFSQFAEGDEIILSNTLVMRTDGRGEDVGKTTNPDDPANQLLKFKVVGPAVSDPSSNPPSSFRPLPKLPDISRLPRKVFKFERLNGQWAINGKFWDPDVDHTDAAIANPANVVRRNSAEIWTLESTSGGWDHPMHIHFEEGQIISQNGVSISEASRHRMDIYRLRQNKIDVYLQFRDYPEVGFNPPSNEQAEQTKADHGRYVMHCHNVVHEDHAMMATWSIQP